MPKSISRFYKLKGIKKKTIVFKKKLPKKAEESREQWIQNTKEVLVQLK
jgi:hypothetical protein